LSARVRDGARRAASRRPPHPLVARGLGKRFGSLSALDTLDLSVRAGAVVGLVGPNGSGKTTALHVIAGLVRPDRGAVLVAGAPAGTLAARNGLALVPDEPGGFEELTVREYVALVHALYRAGAAARARAARLVAAFGLSPRLDSRLRSLSRGLRRQASVVAGFSLARPLVLLDEATATLDPEAVVVLREAVAALARGGSGVLLATQDLHFAETVCDEVVLLRRGGTVAAGTVGALLDRFQSDSLETAFLAAVGEPALIERVRAGLGSL